MGDAHDKFVRENDEWNRKVEASLAGLERQAGPDPFEALLSEGFIDGNLICFPRDSFEQFRAAFVLPSEASERVPWVRDDDETDRLNRGTDA